MASVFESAARLRGVDGQLQRNTLVRYLRVVLIEPGMDQFRSMERLLTE